MSKKNDRTVYRRDDGQWANKKNFNSQASSLHRTQSEAEARAREMLKNSDGGEMTTARRNGRFRSKDTIAPGNDPFPPRDTEH
jgi:hypothetical protein